MKTNNLNIMKLSRKLILAGMVLAGTAFAQSEQWLEYHTGTEGRAYQSLKLTTNPPAGVVLPKLNAPPYFARWLTPMDPSGGRWLCLDRTRKSGPYDRCTLTATATAGWTTRRPFRRGWIPTSSPIFRHAACFQGRGWSRSLITSSSVLSI
jgi:hypothetical protein